MRVTSTWRRSAACTLVVCLLAFPSTVQAGNIVVVSEADSGKGTLRAAIDQANASFGGDTITFGDNVERISLTTSLPALDDATGGITIDGGGDVILDGTNGASTGITVESDNNTIRGLIIINMGFAGIVISGGNNNTVQGCWLGTDGVSADVGNDYGISVLGMNNLIGGPNPEDRNVIADNEFSGIAYSSADDIGNVIEGNYIGTDVTGMFARGNGEDGIFGGNGHNNIIRNNVVAASARFGIFVGNGTASGNRIEGNIVGLNAAGTAALPNAFDGIYVSRPDNTIGGSEPGEGNIASGNTGVGIRVSAADNVEIQGNIVGLGTDGFTPIGNGSHGIEVDIFTDNATIGGTEPGAGNTIAGNAAAGILVEGTSDTIFIRGNRIGTAIDGVTPAGTQLKGIFLQDAIGVEIGGAIPEAGNIIANHTEQGIHGILPAVSEITVRQNAIYANGLQGILWAGGVNDTSTIPVLTGFDPIAGTCASLETIEIFVDDEDEGRILVDTVQATPGGTFSSAVSLLPYAGLNLTATATASDGSTSMFSAPLLIDIEVPFHTADQDGDNTISLSELLRVIQFFNSAGFGCEVGTEDGYNPNDPDTGCTPHSSDYNPQDWEISLSELLRLIQFFNSGGYFACPGEDPPTEDGFCPGTL